MTAADTSNSDEGAVATGAAAKITTVIFDVDDTLYDVSTGFTAHRNTDGAVNFMMDRLNFPTREAAQELRDEYFQRYHATAKALKVADEEGRLPPGAPKFDPLELSQHWADNLDFSYLGTKETYSELRSVLQSLQESSDSEIKLVAFSNGPRAYVLRALREMGLDTIFPDNLVYAVTDLLPHAKPEPEAFLEIFRRLGGVSPEECVMVEDSMKNIRAAKKLGMKTVLVAGKGALTCGDKGDGAEAAEATKTGDAPNASDPSVDVAVEVAAEMKDAIPGLWESPPVFLTA
eukprot:CAMPEP_0197444282 /NCGR_PEP_ID=MMETSP1175-20131217/9811_1 /TAXON_ID=1003142 /ORGANISM="Triceratium dubium, Strain CCMP147" /LENGTH=288 /DNA_ID=CAMNT_0042975049 /DNA_START=158 /DNA_END=1027 /DNA_ORIENTATION=+